MFPILVIVVPYITENHKQNNQFYYTKEAL